MEIDYLNGEYIANAATPMIFLQLYFYCTIGTIINAFEICSNDELNHKQ